MADFLKSLLIVLVALLLLFYLAILLTTIADMVRDWSFRKRFRTKWGPNGKFVLFVYSNSPNWQAYIEDRILPQIEDVAVILNWSERQSLKRTSPLEFRAFLLWAGPRDFNPVAIVVPPAGKVRVVRFWKAFRDHKHGKPGALDAAERRLKELVVEFRPASE